MDAEEVFLSCSNLTLGQYRAVTLAWGLTGAAACIVSLAVLGIILLIQVTKKQALENLPKRVYLATVLYTLLNSSMVIAAVNYSHPPSQEAAWCEALGFLLHYTGTLMIVHYCALAFTLVFQVTVPVYLEAVRKKKQNVYSPKKAKREVLLYLILFLCPLLNTWEPFLPQLPSYGNYGPLCWFQLEVTDNCTANKSDELFLRTIPFAVVCFGISVLTFTVSLALCCMYCKFHTKTIGSRIITVIPTIALVTVISFLMMLWFILLAITAKSQIGPFSTWVEHVTVAQAGTIGMLVVVGIYVHFPTHLCLYCKRALPQEGGQNEQQVIHPPESAPYHNTQCSQMMYTNTHSRAPVTTEATPLISPCTCHPEVDHHKYPTYTTCSISHEPVTTDIYN